MAIKVSGTEVISDDKRILNNESLPDIRPSLLLDFANSKTLDPRITFTRGSTATYWDGKTTAKAEENLYEQSQVFNTSPWTAVRLTLTGSQTAPDGTSTAFLLEQQTGETSGGNVRQLNKVLIAGEQYTFSIFAKAGAKDFLYVNVGHTSNAQIWFDLSNGTVGTEQAGIDSSNITSVGNGWYRCSAQFTVDTATSTIFYHLADSDGVVAVTDSGGIYLWGAQLEQRSSATAYTATTSSPIVKYQPVLQTAASGEARFDHDPVTGESKGLLIEEARTNLAPYGQTLDNAQWAKVNVTVTADQAIAPDGTLSADLIQQGTSTDYLVVEDYITNNLSTDTVYTASAFVKYAGDVVEFGVFDSTAGHMGRVDFDASIPSISMDNGTDYGYEDVGNGWYRIWVTFTSGSTLTSSRIRYLLNQGQYGTGDGWSGVLAWGAQVEEGSFPTSYIPTSGSTVTRAGDSALMTGANLSSWFRQDEGTIYVNYGNANLGGNIIPDPYVVAFSGGTSASSNPSMRIRLEDTNNSAALQVLTASGDISANFGNYVPTDLTDVRITAAYGTDNFALSVSDSSFETDTSGNAATGITYLHLGHDNGALNGHIKKFAYYPKRLPNATLQAMTEA